MLVTPQFISNQLHMTDRLPISQTILTNTITFVSLAILRFKIHPPSFVMLFFTCKSNQSTLSLALNIASTFKPANCKNGSSTSTIFKLGPVKSTKFEFVERLDNKNKFSEKILKCRHTITSSIEHKRVTVRVNFGSFCVTSFMNGPLDPL